MRKLPCILVIIIALASLGCPVEEQESSDEYSWEAFRISRSIVHANPAPTETTFDSLQSYIDDLKTKDVEEVDSGKVTRDGLYMFLTDKGLDGSEASIQVEALKSNDNNVFELTEEGYPTHYIILYVWR
jgi:hypothetical protein